MAQLIGVSIAVPEPWASRIQQARRSYGDPLADSVRTHITLLPPTEIAEMGPALRQHLAAVASAHTRFTVSVAGTDSFRPISDVAYLRVISGGEQLAELADAVRTGVLARDLNFPYHPHVTLAHGVSEAALDRAIADMAAVAFDVEVDEVQLYVFDDASWREVEGFALS